MERGRSRGRKHSLLRMRVFENIVNAENDALCSLPTFLVRDKPFYVEPSVIKALRKQRLLKNIRMESEKPRGPPRYYAPKGDLDGLIDGILEC